LDTEEAKWDDRQRPALIRTDPRALRRSGTATEQGIRQTTTLATLPLIGTALEMPRQASPATNRRQGSAQDDFSDDAAQQIEPHTGLPLIPMDRFAGHCGHHEDDLHDEHADCLF
jgi:hypothetical protein